MTGLLSVTAIYSMTTPCFLKGADDGVPRIRESGIKGALAFWWRAWAFGRFVGPEGNPQGGNAAAMAAALVDLQKKEVELFGGPRGQGCFLLEVVSGTEAFAWRKPDKTGARIMLRDESLGFPPRQGEHKKAVGVGARYLGYRLMEAFRIDKNSVHGAEVNRDFIPSGTSFTLRILFKRTVKEEQIEDVVRALKLLGLVGGLGARVRRGWGSLALLSLQGSPGLPPLSWAAPATPEAYWATLADVLSDGRPSDGTLFPLTAFTEDTQIHVGTDGYDRGLDALDALGRAYVAYRGWGKNGKWGTQPVESAFKEEHDWFKGIGVIKKDFVPQRTAFGLPIVFSKNVDVKPKHSDLNRRASPLFFHIHPFGDTYKPVALFFNTLFLPEGEGRNVVVSRKGEDEWKKAYTLQPGVITDFLNGMCHQDDRTPSTVKSGHALSFEVFPR